MTTLSTLIGSGSSSFGMGAAVAAPRPSLWQRLSGRLKRQPVDAAGSAEGVAAFERSAGVDSDSDGIDALEHIVDDRSSAFDQALSPDELALDVDRLSDSLDDSVDRSVDHSIDESPKLDFNGPSLFPPTPPRRRLLWGSPRRDAVLDEMRHGMGALASLLGGIQTHMEAQGARQDELVRRQQELIACLSHLPLASAAQTENLSAIRDQLARTAENQERFAMNQERFAESQDRFAASQDRLVAAQDKLCGALDRVNALQETTGSALKVIGTRIEQMDQRDAVFTKSLEKVSLAMETVSRASEAGAKVLDRVQMGLSTREDAMEETLDKHQGKFNALMAVAIAVSAAAIAVTAGVGYMVFSKM